MSDKRNSKKSKESKIKLKPEHIAFAVLGVLLVTVIVMLIVIFATTPSGGGGTTLPPCCT